MADLAGRLRRRALLLAALGGLAALPGRAQQNAVRIMPLPELPVPVRLRVAYFHNPNLPAPDPAFRAEVLRQAVPLARSLLGLTVAFGAEERILIADAFRGVPPGWRRMVWRPEDGRRDLLVRSMLRELTNSGTSLQEMVGYARPHLVTASVPATFAELAEALVETHLARFARWSRQLDDGDFHQYLAWLAAPAALRWPYEVVLTNQLLASVEYGPTSIHSALRGGVTNGLTPQSPASAYGLVSVLSLYPFTSNDESFVALRGGVRAEGLEPAKWAAALLVHELGHQLLHLSHPYGRPACVMNAPPLLDFRKWVAGLDGAACPIGSSKDMERGVLKFREIRP